MSGEYLIAQNINQKLLIEIKELGNFRNKIFSTVTHQGNISWRLKIDLRNEYPIFMERAGYKGRTGNEQRGFPPGMSNEEEYEFIKGYFCTHYTLDSHKSGRPRLRFYAAEKLLELMNIHLNREIDTSVKKVTDHHKNDVCKILYYQSKKEVPTILDYLQLNKSK